MISTKHAAGGIQLKGPGGIAEAAVILTIIVLFVIGIAYAAWRLAKPDDTQISAQGASKHQGILGFIRSCPLFSYFFLAYLISWLSWLPLALSQNGLGLLPFHLPVAVMALGAFGPIASGILLTSITSGKAGLRQLMRRFMFWRVGMQWYGAALLGFPILQWMGILFAVPGALTDFHLYSHSFRFAQGTKRNEIRWL